MAALCQGARRVGGGPAESGVVVRAEAAVQGAVGGGHGGDAGDAEFVDEAPLERAVGPPGGLVEVPDIAPQVLVPGPVPLPVPPQEPLSLGHRHRPGAHPQHVGHRQPALPPAQGAQDHFLDCQRPLHGGLGGGHGAPLGAHDTPTARWERSGNVLPTPIPRAP